MAYSLTSFYKFCWKRRIQTYCKMNSYFIAAFLFCTVVVVSAQKCIEQEECPEGMCCSGFPPFGGICRNLTAAGGLCHIVDKTVPVFGDFVIGPCPCAEGLVCVQEGTKKNNGICQLPATTTAAPVPEEPVSKVSGEDSGSEVSGGDSGSEVSSENSGSEESGEESLSEISADEPVAKK